MGKILKEKPNSITERIDEGSLVKKENIEILKIDELIAQIKIRVNMSSFGLLLTETEIELLILS